jgi:hypothetical protein
VDRRFWIFLVLGLAVVGAGIFMLLTTTSGAHLRLEGKILKVRVLPLTGSAASLVIVDFRATNPSDVPFVASSVTLQLDPAKGDTLDGTPISKPDVDNVFRYEKLLGPKYNDVFSLQDRIAPHQTADRMAAARFNITESAVNSRKALRVRLEDVDGAVAELTEAPAASK